MEPTKRLHIDNVQKFQKTETIDVKSKLSDSRPVDVVAPLVVTLHSHRIVIERQDYLYKTLATVETIMLLVASFSLITVSVTSVIFAMKLLQGAI